jgi:hypothetical protein
MGLFLDVLGGLAKEVFKTDPHASLRREIENERRAYVEKQKNNMALPCRRCKTLAEPIEGTKNRYRCACCGNQFAAARHHL